MGVQGTLTLTTHTHTYTHINAHMCFGQVGVQGTLTHNTHLYTHVQWTGESAGRFTLTVTLTHKHAPIYRTRWECRALCNNTNNTHLYTHVCLHTCALYRWECRALYNNTNPRVYTHKHAPIYSTRWERRALCNNTNNIHLHTHARTRAVDM